MTQSTEASGRGSLSIVARWNSTLLRPCFAAFDFARSIMSGVMSIPIALPVGPTFFAARNTSSPPQLGVVPLQDSGRRVARHHREARHRLVETNCRPDCLDRKCREVVARNRVHPLELLHGLLSIWVGSIPP